MPLTEADFNERKTKFFGQVLDMTAEEGEYGPQYRVSGKSVDPEYVGERSFWFAKKHTPQSKWMMFLKSWEPLGIKMKEANDLIGAWVQMVQVSVPLTEEFAERTGTSHYNTWRGKAIYPDEETCYAEYKEYMESAPESFPLEADAVEDPMPEKLKEQFEGMYKALGQDDSAFLGAVHGMGRPNGWTDEDILELVRS